MPMLFQIDEAHLLVPTVALSEIIRRGSLVALLSVTRMRGPSNVRHGLPTLSQLR